MSEDIGGWLTGVPPEYGFGIIALLATFGFVLRWRNQRNGNRPAQSRDIKSVRERVSGLHEVARAHGVQLDCLTAEQADTRAELQAFCHRTTTDIGELRKGQDLILDHLTRRDS